MLEILSKDSDVEYIEPNIRRTPHANIPDDPHFSYQWALHNTGQSILDTAGSEDADIDFPELRTIIPHDLDTVIVAIVDSGIAYKHPDLEAHMWHDANCVNFDG